MSFIFCFEETFLELGSAEVLPKVTVFSAGFYYFFKKWAIPGLFFVYFHLFKQSLQFLQQKM